MQHGAGVSWISKLSPCLCQSGLRLLAQSSSPWGLKDEVVNSSLLQTTHGQSLFENLAEVHCHKKLCPMNKYLL